ncbi:MAG: hypothetical protein ACYC99_01935 [Candidatus Geothermincolia bacterium]
MSIMRKLGRAGGKVGSNREFVSGLLEEVDPDTISDVINENPELVGRVVGGIDPVVLLASLDPEKMGAFVNESLGLIAETAKYVDFDALIQFVNSYELQIPEFLGDLKPELISRLLAVLLGSLRHSNYRPFFLEPGEEAK